MGAAAILASIRSEEGRQRFKRVMLKIYNSIGAAYMGDPDFQRPDQFYPPVPPSA